MGYSQPVKKTVNKKQLLKKLYSLPKQPKAIPYINVIEKKRWKNFCASHQKNV